MTMKMKKAEMIAKIITTLQRLRGCEQTFREAAKAGNPQILEMLHRTQGEINAFTAVLDSLTGSCNVMMNNYGKGII